MNIVWTKGRAVDLNRRDILDLIDVLSVVAGNEMDSERAAELIRKLQGFVDALGDKPA